MANNDKDTIPTYTNGFVSTMVVLFKVLKVTMVQYLKDTRLKQPDIGSCHLVQT